MSRELTSAETPDEIADCVVGYAQRGLQLPLTAVAYYEEETGELSAAAQTARAEDGLPTATLCAPGTGAAWDAFVLNETRFVDGVGNGRSIGIDPSEVVAIPLARHGVFLAASTSGGFGPGDRDFLGTVAATIESVLTRAERKAAPSGARADAGVPERDAPATQPGQRIIRSIDQALVRASTRSEIEAVVCSELARTGPYDLAWIGGYDAVTGELTPRERDGDGTGYPDVTVGTAGDERTPTAEAITARGPRVVANVLTDPPLEEWQKRALDRGYRSIIALPLAYRQSLYGVLTVYASQPGVFDGLEGAVLEELSDTIAHAMHVVESKRTLVGDGAATTRQEFETALVRERTDRQLEVLKTSYASGFFESPRERTGTEIAATLGIT